MIYVYDQECISEDSGLDWSLAHAFPNLPEFHFVQAYLQVKPSWIHLCEMHSYIMLFLGLDS